MLCWQNEISLYTLTSATVTTGLQTLKDPLKAGYAVIPASSDKYIRLAGVTRPHRVIAAIGVKPAVEISAFQTQFINVSLLTTTTTEQRCSPASHQTGIIGAVYAEAITSAVKDIRFYATANAVDIRGLWVGDGVECRARIDMQRGTLGGAEIQQTPEGATFIGERATWRKYSVTLPGVTQDQWERAGGLQDLESVAEGREVLLFPSGKSTCKTFSGTDILTSENNGALAIHGVISGFQVAQLRNNLRAVSFALTECL